MILPQMFKQPWKKLNGISSFLCFRLSVLVSCLHLLANIIHERVRPLFVRDTRFHQVQSVALKLIEADTCVAKMSRCRITYSSGLEEMINEQINMELANSAEYLAISVYCARDDVGLPNVAKAFMKRSDEERDHAKEFMEFQLKRGGRIHLEAINSPKDDFDTSPLKNVALVMYEAALKLEKKVSTCTL